MTITAASYTDHIEFDTGDDFPAFGKNLIDGSTSMFYMFDPDCKRGLIEYHMVHVKHDLAVAA